MGKIIKKLITIIVFGMVVNGCQSEIEKLGKHYQINKDYESLSKVVKLMKSDADTAYVKRILGEPINMGFDYRYLVDSVSPNGCPVGAVFHITKDGRIGQKWIDEICE